MLLPRDSDVLLRMSYADQLQAQVSSRNEIQCTDADKHAMLIVLFYFSFRVSGGRISTTNTGPSTIITRTILQV